MPRKCFSKLYRRNTIPVYTIYVYTAIPNTKYTIPVLQSEPVVTPKLFTEQVLFLVLELCNINAVSLL